ncbi:MAG: hypothetical protein M1356_02450 [Gammaproteobacteria bacterium]|nr:hypothetical protein [Gammaproteobacteria bacterium]
MSLIFQAKSQLAELRNLLNRLSNDDYTYAAALPHAPTIGRHVRHIIEHYEQLLDHSHCGSVNYEQRPRQHILEQSTQHAIRAINRLEQQLTGATLQLDQSLMLFTESEAIKTSFARELNYLFNHTVHHLATVHCVMTEIGLTLDESSDVHPSTRQFIQSCAQ